MNHINNLLFIIKSNKISSYYIAFYFFWFVLNLFMYQFFSSPTAKIYSYALTYNYFLMHVSAIIAIFIIIREIIGREITNFLVFKKEISKIIKKSRFCLSSSLVLFFGPHLILIFSPHLFIYFLDFISHANQNFVILMFMQFIIFLAYNLFLGSLIMSLIIITNNKESISNIVIFLICAIIGFPLLICPWSSLITQNALSGLYINYISNESCFKIFNLVDKISPANIIYFHLSYSEDHPTFSIMRSIYTVITFLFFTVLIILIDYYFFKNKYKDFLKISK